MPPRGVTEQDAKIAGIAHDRGKGIIVGMNGISMHEKNDKTIYKHTEKIRQILSFMPYAQIIFISAKTGQRLPKLFENIDTVIENQTLRTRQVFLMRSFLRQSLFSSRRLTEEED